MERPTIVISKRIWALTCTRCLRPDFDPFTSALISRSSLAHIAYMNVLRQLSQRSFFCTPSASALHRVAPGVPAHLRYARPQAPSFGSQRLLSSTPPRVDETASSSSAPKSPETHDKVTFKTEEPRLSLTFTCTVTTCGTRSSHMFTRRSYERGIVIVQCPGCRNRCVAKYPMGVSQVR